LSITGLPEQCNLAKREIMEIVSMGQTAQGFKMDNDMSYAFMAMQQCNT